MKRWAWLVAGLYAVILLAVTVPGIWLAFAPKMAAREALRIFVWPFYWPWLGAMFVSQLTLLAVPVRAACVRPMSRGPIWRTVLAAGFMAASLVGAAVLSLCEFWRHENALDTPYFWTAVALGMLSWCLWALIFLRLSRRTEPSDLVSRQCRCLFKGSVLELLIAVPTHIAARHRDYCCAGYLTFLGLAMGASVMLFAFGPAVFFLFIGRWRRLRPGANATQNVCNQQSKTH